MAVAVIFPDGRLHRVLQQLGGKLVGHEQYACESSFQNQKKKHGRTFMEPPKVFGGNQNLVNPIFRSQPVKRMFINIKVRGFTTVSGCATAKSVSVDTRRRTTPQTGNQPRSNTKAFVAMTAAGTEPRAKPRSSNTNMSSNVAFQGDIQKAI